MVLNEKDFRILQLEETILSGITVLKTDLEIPKKLRIEISETLRQDLNIITVLKGAAGYVLQDTDIEVIYKGGHTFQKIILFDNRAQNVIVRNCRFKLYSETQVTVIGLRNFGLLNTMLDSGADMTVIENCRFDIRVLPNEFPFGNQVCAIENKLANSVSIHGNYIFAQLNGEGAGQKVFGVINTGRFLRCENNNIKANGCHNKGELLKATHSCGFYNDGQYLIFTGNNCVGEWGGRCVGLENRSQYCTITGNKILATHTICGRTVVISGNRNIVGNNILTGTSRNPRGVEIRGNFNIVSGNYLETLQPADVVFSGCGIWVEGENGVSVEGCVITDNMIVHARDFGIYLDRTRGIEIRGNQFCKYIETDDFIAVLQQNSNDNRIETVCSDDLITETDLFERIARNREDAICSLE